MIIVIILVLLCAVDADCSSSLGTYIVDTGYDRKYTTHETTIYMISCMKRYYSLGISLDIIIFDDRHKNAWKFVLLPRVYFLDCVKERFDLT
jgi:hypothetical protein